jgi:hypothetical protein
MKKQYYDRYSRYDNSHNIILDPFDRVVESKCADCINFVRDGIGDGSGVGQCLVNGRYQLKFRNMPLYPNVVRKCINFNSNLL